MPFSKAPPVTFTLTKPVLPPRFVLIEVRPFTETVLQTQRLPPIRQTLYIPGVK